MDWGYSALSTAAPPLRAPEDGIVASQRLKGRVAKRWDALLKQLPVTMGQRLRHLLPWLRLLGIALIVVAVASLVPLVGALLFGLVYLVIGA